MISSELRTPDGVTTPNVKNRTLASAMLKNFLCIAILMKPGFINTLFKPRLPSYLAGAEFLPPVRMLGQFGPPYQRTVAEARRVPQTLLFERFFERDTALLGLPPLSLEIPRLDTGKILISRLSLFYLRFGG